MGVYLQDIPLEDAQKIFRQKLEEQNLWGILGVEKIAVDENALGRVLAEPIWAKISSPHYHSAAMDGFAIRSAMTNGATVTHPLELKVGEEAVYVDTGDPLPQWCDAVIPLEQVEPLSTENEISPDIRQPYVIRIRSAVVPWHNVRPMGEDIVATQLVLPSGHELRAVDLGAIAACGWSEINVNRRPRVAIIPTGDELVPIGTKVKAGDIIEYNSVVLAAQVRAYGALATRYPIVRDNFDNIKAAVEEAAKGHDLILLNAGSSAGAEDYSAAVIKTLGEVYVHGIAVRPGHPVIMGMIQTNAGQEKYVPIIGVPGYPVSAALTIEIFVKPIIERWLGKQPSSYPQIEAVMTKKITSPSGDDDYVRVVVGKVGNRICAAPLARGAGVITSLTQADGLVVIPRGTQGIEAGQRVTVNLLREKTQIDNTIMAIGSHDVSLDVLAQFVAKRNTRLVSANVGSLGGLLAIKREEAHLAGSHLLHPD
ncbi:MAG: gephyrin-like molybdotransferase Glp, partial [Anaerolineales bacterium]